MKKIIKTVSLFVAGLAIALGLNFASQNTADAAVAETPLHGILTVRYNGRGGVNLLDNNGKYQMQYVRKNSRWKVFAKATINGKLMYRLGNERQWIPAQYASLSNAPAQAAQNRKPAAPAHHGTNMAIVGNKRTKKYHLVGQERYNISPANRVYFSSEAQAIRAGYHRSLK